jgi:ribonuclease P protein component
MEINSMTMLPKINRLKKNNDFQKVFKSGRGFSEDFLFLKFLDNGLKISRFGFIISNKITKKATLRNKIKRKLRELVRQKLPKIKKGLDVVIVVRALPDTENFKKIEKVMDRLFSKAGLISY